MSAPGFTPGRRWAAGELGRRSSSLVSFALIARSLSTDEFAVFVLVAAGFSIILTVVQSAADRLLVRTWIEDAEAARQLARLSTASTAVLTVVAAAVALPLAAEISAAIALYGTSVVAQVAVWGEESKHRACGELGKSNRFKSVGEVSPSAARALGAVLGGTLEWVMVLSAAAGLAIAWFGRANLLPPRRGSLSQTGVRSVLLTAGVGLGSAAYFRVDLFMLSALAASSDVAGYAIATKMLEVVLVIPSVYGQLSIADFVRSKVTAGLAWRRGLRLIRWGVVIALLMLASALPIEILADELLHKPVSAGVVALLALTVPVAYFGAVLGNICYAQRRERTLLIALTSMLALNVALNLVLIPRHGAHGAAISTAVTEFLGVSLLALQLRPAIDALRRVGAT